MSRTPVAVLISDVHYNLQTLSLADAAMRHAISAANALCVPLVVAGDLHDTKANLRGECVNAMLETFEALRHPAFILRGNHDSINERLIEHSLTFLNAESKNDDEEPVGLRVVVPKPWFYNGLGPINGKSVHLIPYHHDPDELRKYLKKVDKGSAVIMHQGLSGSNMGEYVQDKSAIRPEDVAGLRVISGHYHTRQTIQLPDGGVWDYVGNPFTLSWAEANDPPKGFQVLYSDGSLEFVPTTLRKHVVVNLDMSLRDVDFNKVYAPGDLVKVRFRGPRAALAKHDKESVAALLGLTVPFQLDLIPTDATIQLTDAQLNLSGAALLDSLIDSLPETTADRKTRLKGAWRGLCY